MNKYLKGFINFIISIAIGIVGVLVSLNIWFMSLLFFPEVATKVDGTLGANPSWFALNLFPGLIPLFYVLIGLSLCIFIMFNTIKLMKKFDIGKIIDAIRIDFNSNKAKRKEAKNG